MDNKKFLTSDFEIKPKRSCWKIFEYISGSVLKQSVAYAKQINRITINHELSIDSRQKKKKSRKRERLFAIRANNRAQNSVNIKK